MKVLLLPMGSYGDIHPYLGLGLRMKSRGHDVIVAANVYFQELFQSHGLQFVPLKTSSNYNAFYKRAELCNPAQALIAAGKWCVLEPMQEIFHFIQANYITGETVVAAPYACFGARIAQEKSGVPLATVTLLPFDLRSAYHAPKMPRPMLLEDWVPKISKRIQYWIMDRFFADHVLGPTTNGFRATLGLLPIKRFLAGWCFSPDRVIAFYPDWYAPRQPDWPQNTIMTGFPRWDPAVSLNEHREASEFIKKGDSPIVFTPGSYNQHSRQFFKASIECCITLGKRGILLTKYREQLPEVLPKEVKHFDYVHLEALLPYAAALVNHGGIGTLAQALAHAVPQIIMPIAFNQPDDAVRLKRMGVADFIPPKKFKGSLLTKKMEQLLSSESVAERLRDLAGRFHGVDPIGQACELLEELRGIDLKRKVPCL